MTTYNLSLLQEDAVFDIERTIDNISTDLPWPTFQKKARGLCDNFLILAAASLLADFKLDLFFLNLCRSAENWRRFLIISEKDYEDGVACLHYNTPLLAAVIANDKSLLGNIKAMLPKQWQPGEEYEDQFHISWIFLLLSLNNCQFDDEVKAHLNALETCESEQSYFELFQSLLGINTKTEQDFWGDFENLLYKYEEDTEAKALKSSTPIQRFAAKRFLYFEGLAALRLADIKGYTRSSSHYLYCPSDALSTMPVSYPNDWVILSDSII